MSRRYIGEERDTLRAKVKNLRTLGHSFKDISAELDISPTFAGVLFRESQKPTHLSLFDRLRLWFTFKM